MAEFDILHNEGIAKTGAVIDAAVNLEVITKSGTWLSFEDKKHLLYVNPQNPKDLKDKIIYLLNNPQIASKLGNKASMLVKNNYTTYHLAKRLTNFIDKL